MDTSAGTNYLLIKWLSISYLFRSNNVEHEKKHKKWNQRCTNKWYQKIGFWKVNWPNILDARTSFRIPWRQTRSGDLEPVTSSKQTLKSKGPMDWDQDLNEINKQENKQNPGG